MESDCTWSERGDYGIMEFGVLTRSSILGQFLMVIVETKRLDMLRRC